MVEPTCQTLVTRLPALVACGTRVQTIPDALATSIAATRPTISSCSSTSTCWPAGTDRPPPITGRRRAARGLGWDTETLTGVLVATVRDPAVGPRRQTQARPPTAKDTSASAGNPTHFHASTASHKGYLDSGEDPRPRWQTAWYLPGRRGPRPLRGAVNGPGAVSCCPSSSSGVAQGHEPLTMDRRPSAVLTHVLAGRTRHRRCRTYGATIDAVSYAASPCCGCGRLKSIGSTGLLPSNPTTTSRATIPSSQPGQSPTTVALLADARQARRPS